MHESCYTVIQTSGMTLHWTTFICGRYTLQYPPMLCSVAMLKDASCLSRRAVRRLLLEWFGLTTLSPKPYTESLVE